MRETEAGQKLLGLRIRRVEKMKLIYGAGLSAMMLLGSADANGVLRYGFGADDAGTAGAFAGSSGDSLAAMQTNPAAMAALDGAEWTLALRAGFGLGTYWKAGADYEMDVSGVFPELALAWRPELSPVVFGFSVAPLAAVASDWLYPDAAGGIGGISYGTWSHESGFLSLRANAGVAWEINEEWSVGASFGAVYSRVDFDAPFIFQSNPALAGAKVDLDLETDGWAPMAEFGVLWRPDKNWRVGLRARPQVNLKLYGEADVDFSAQLPPLGLGGTPPRASYEAATKNALPAVIGGGLAWDATSRLRFGLWADWIGWSSAFDHLDVALGGGTNAQINGAIGSGFTDQVPVGWEDVWVVALGAEYDLSSSWTIRAGWRWGDSPVPASLATPLNASLLEHALSLGLGWRSDCWRLDLSYEYQFGSSEVVAVSGYRAGEYSNSKLDFSAHVLGFGMTRSF